MEPLFGYTLAISSLILIMVSVTTDWSTPFGRARQVALGTMFSLIVDSSIDDHPGDQKI